MLSNAIQRAHDALWEAVNFHPHSTLECPVGTTEIDRALLEECARIEQLANTLGFKIERALTVQVTGHEYLIRGGLGYPDRNEEGWKRLMANQERT